METKKITKWWWAWNFDKEERWLNEMAADGWKLVDAKFIWFTFEKCEPGEYIVRLEMNDPAPEYREILEESGAQCVGNWFRWHYYIRKAELGCFVLQGDLNSKIEHLNRIIRMLKIVCAANLIIGLSNSLSNHAGWINLLCATLLAYGWGRIEGKKDSLIDQREIQE